MSSILPLEITNREVSNPKVLVIAGRIKVGKTTFAGDLTTKHNFLLVDLEPKDGSDGVTARKIKMKDFAKQHYPMFPEWQAFIMLIKTIQKEKPYTGLIIDNTSRLEDYAKEWALVDYKKKNPKFEGNDVYNAPHGAGYGETREKFEALRNLIEGAAEHVVYIAHLKLKTDFASGDKVETIDLTGGMKDNLVQYASAIGFFSINEKGERQISFKHDPLITDMGARTEYLSQQIVPNNWDYIYRYDFKTGAYRFDEKSGATLPKE